MQTCSNPQPRFARQPPERGHEGAICYLVDLFKVGIHHFRIEDFATATHVVRKIVTDIASPVAVGSSSFTFVCNMLLVVIFLLFDGMLYKRCLIREDRFAQPTLMNVVWVVVLLLMLGLFGVSADNFVYFQF